MATQTKPTQDTISFSFAYLCAKRALDVILTLLILPPLCVIIVIVAAAIKLDSHGPAFFRQKRIGQNGIEFNMFKFRSMYDHCDDNFHRQAIEHYINDRALNEICDAAGMRYKVVKDPRITRVGRFIRKTSIDELPQFFNVLQGKMTLVGPRPALPYEVEQYRSRDRLRLCGKPGLTGFWQIYGRSRVPFSCMVEMDIAYLQKQSLWEDLKLIVLTVPVMIKGHGGA
jgi:lipopolysaccharide/colanic/teichoic acid biosynthesis glycosyltransferase